LNNVEAPNQKFHGTSIVLIKMSFQNEQQQYNDLGAREFPLVLLAVLLVPVDWVPGITAVIREGDDRVRQLALSDQLVRVLVLVDRFVCVGGARIGGIVAPAVLLNQVVTAALGIDGLCTGRVGMIFAAVTIRRRIVVDKVVRATGLERTALDLQGVPRTLVESVPTSHVVIIVVTRALFGNTLTLAWGGSSSGQGSEGGQDGK